MLTKSGEGGKIREVWRMESFFDILREVLTMEIDLYSIFRIYNSSPFFYAFLCNLEKESGVGKKSIVLFGNRFNNMLPNCIDLDNEAFIGTVFLVGKAIIFYPEEGLRKMRLFPGVLREEKGAFNLVQMQIEEGGGARIRKVFHIKGTMDVGFYEVYFETQLGYGRYFLPEYTMDKLRNFCK